MWKSLTVATLTTLALTLPAHADTQFSYVDEAGKPATQLYVKDGKVRMETGGDAMMFDASSGTFTVIDHAEQSYMVMDAATMERMAAQAGQMQQRMAPQMAEMQAQMEHMSPEQRAMVEQMMGGLAANAADPSAMAMAAPKVEMKDMGGTRKVAGFRCKDVQMVVGGQSYARMCLAQLDSLDIPAADRATLEAMHEGMRHMTEMGPGAPSVPDIMPDGLAIAYQPEGPAVEDGDGPETLKAISHGGLKPDLFTVPAGYTEQKMPDMGGR